jgi:hypothetical protein
MKNLDRRVTALEQKSQDGAEIVGSIIRSFVCPSGGGPVDCGRAVATILSGPNNGLRLHRRPDEPIDAFEVRVRIAKSG